MITVIKRGHGDPCSNARRVCFISHSTNTLGKSINPIILPQAIGKQ